MNDAPGRSVLITGAAGFIGSHVVDRLLAQGEDVVGLDNFDTFYSPAIKDRNLASARRHPGFTEVRGDIRDPGVLADLPSGVDTVIHLAARAGVRPSIADPMLYNDVNVTGTLRLLEWMRAAGVPRLLFASSSSVYGDRSALPFREDDDVGRPISPYAATKRACELQCHCYHHLFGLSVIALRLFTVYGPRQRPDLAIHKFARLIRDGHPVPMYGDGGSERDYTFVDDIVDGVTGALERVRAAPPMFEIINLAESRTVGLGEMIRILGEEMGIAPRIEQHPAQPGDVSRTFADISKARDLLGYAPSTGFRTGIRRFLEWFREDSRGEA